MTVISNDAQNNRMYTMMQEQQRYIKELKQKYDRQFEQNKLKDQIIGELNQRIDFLQSQQNTQNIQPVQQQEQIEQNDVQLQLLKYKTDIQQMKQTVQFYEDTQNNFVSNMQQKHNQELQLLQQKQKDNNEKLLNKCQSIINQFKEQEIKYINQIKQQESDQSVIENKYNKLLIITYKQYEIINQLKSKLDEQYENEQHFKKLSKVSNQMLDFMNQYSQQIIKQVDQSQLHIVFYNQYISNINNQLDVQKQALQDQYNMLKDKQNDKDFYRLFIKQLLIKQKQYIFQLENSQQQIINQQNQQKQHLQVFNQSKLNWKVQINNILQYQDEIVTKYADQHNVIINNITEIQQQKRNLSNLELKNKNVETQSVKQQLQQNQTINTLKKQLHVQNTKIKQQSENGELNEMKMEVQINNLQKQLNESLQKQKMFQINFDERVNKEQLTEPCKVLNQEEEQDYKHYQEHINSVDGNIQKFIKNNNLLEKDIFGDIEQGEEAHQKDNEYSEGKLNIFEKSDEVIEINEEQQQENESFKKSEHDEQLQSHTQSTIQIDVQSSDVKEPPLLTEQEQQQARDNDQINISQSSEHTNSIIVQEPEITNNQINQPIVSNQQQQKIQQPTKSNFPLSVVDSEPQLTIVYQTQPDVSPTQQLPEAKQLFLQEKQEFQIDLQENVFNDLTQLNDVSIADKSMNVQGQAESFISMYNLDDSQLEYLGMAEQNDQGKKKNESNLKTNVFKNVQSQND